MFWLSKFQLLTIGHNKPHIEQALESEFSKEATHFNYRKDIQGLRAIAVMSVILFHLGYLPNGYLGVDIFFAISGYLITKIVYKEVLEDRFSLIDFYLRRIRRIIPLVLVVTTVTLIVGLIVMLPDDFENLCQSIIATNFFANNILLLITSKNYWAIANEYKPLMHTWSLGVEEQFYLLYPLIFLLLGGNRKKWILPSITILTLVSFILLLLSNQEGGKFYLLQFRFFELSFGGLAAIIFKEKRINSRYSTLLTICILSILLFGFQLPANLKLLLVVLLSVWMLISGTANSKLNSLLLENQIMIWVGKISFSLYMWHQIVLAYARYFVFEQLGVAGSLMIIVVTIVLSVVSFYLIEEPFRNKQIVKTSQLLAIISTVFFVTCGSAFYLYSIGGITRDVPELELKASENHMNKGDAKRNIHIEYNAKIYDLDKPFADDKRIKVLIIGNSFARDFANILLESKSAKQLEISYTPDEETCKDLNQRISSANFILFSDISITQFNHLLKRFNIDIKKVWNIGTKNFGLNNGLFYNMKGSKNYCKQRTFMKQGIAERNNSRRHQWGNKYINLIGLIIDKEGRVPVFTPDCKFISQDCEHLTHAGAVYFAQLIDVKRIFGIE
ncbi:MAG: acyltransferase 3 [Daejeonella sp.]|nr:acyltransferase 3 [Daejeonella sp.]